MNQVGKYAISDNMDETQLLKMVLELPEKDKMLMWSQGYIDQVIEKMPDYSRDILEERIEKWEDTKGFFENQLDGIVNNKEFIEKAKGDRKEFALFVMEQYPEFQSLLFLGYDGNLKDADLRRFVYRRRYGGSKRYLH